MPTYDSGRAADIGGLNIRQRRGSDLGAIRFADNITTTPTSANDMLLYRRSNSLRFWDGASEYNLLTSVAGSVGSLDGVYDNGRTITVDSGPIVLNDATTGALNTLEINKTGAGSGNLIDVDLTAAFTGNVVNLDMGSGVAAIGIVIDSEGGARTGVDLLFTDDSTAAHSTIQINKSGAGASIAFEYVGSYNGSPAGHVFNIDLNANDSLDTEVMQLTTGTGNRGIMFDFNFAHTDSGTTSHVWDIDMTGVFDSNVFDFATTAACTGNVFFVDLDNGVAMTALHIEGSGVRTQPMVEIDTDATGSASVITSVITGAISGHLWEISMDTTSTGDVFNVDMNASVGGRFLFLDGGAAIRTANLVDVTNDGSGNTDFVEISDSNTGSGHVFDINTSGIGSGNVIDITYSAADTGNALNVAMSSNVAGAALNVTAAGARTDNLIEVTTSETGSVDGIMRMDATGVFTGHMVTLVSSGAATTAGLLHLDLDAGVAYRAITIDHAGARTVADILVTFDGTFGSGGGGTLMDINVSMTGAAASPLFDIDVTGLYTGNIVDIVFSSSASTGEAIHVDMGTNVAGSAIVLDTAGTRTDDLIKIDDTSDGNSHIFDINMTGNYTGNVLDITFATGTATGDAVSLVMGTNVAGSAVVITAAGSRTDDLIKIDDSSSGNSHIFDINMTGVYTGNVLDIVYSTAAATGDAIHVDMGTAVAGSAIVLDAAGTRTDDLIKIDDTSTSNSHVFDINLTGVSTGNVLDIVYSSGAATGDAIHVDMGTNLAGNAIQIDAAGVRTAPLINIVNTGTDGGTDDHVILISQTGLLDSDVINITYATAASTGNAIFIAMGTNVAGSAIQVTSAATGTSAEGAVFDATHTGDLAAGANVVDIISTGSPSSTSNVVSIQQTTGAGSAGAYALYVNATGANVEALKVDAGNVVFDEGLTVTGQITYGTLNDGTTALAATTTELNRGSDVSGRLVAGGSSLTGTIAHESRVVLLDTAAGTTFTLPDATGSGQRYTVIISVVATSNSHIIQVANSSDIMQGIVWTCSTGDTPDLAQPWITAADSDTITLNRTTQGSITIGEWFEFVDVANNTWAVRGFTASSGAEATPFSAAV